MKTGNLISNLTLSFSNKIGMPTLLPEDPNIKTKTQHQKTKTNPKNNTKKPNKKQKSCQKNYKVNFT